MSAAPTVAIPRAVPHRAGRWRRNLTFDKISLFLVFLGLPLALYITFVVSPLIQAVSYSFTDWSGFTPDFKPVGVTDTVIASIDVAKAPFNINDRLFRMRKLVIEPMGIVPWHSHADRPAIIYIIEGEINEYASNCAVPIVHKAGDVVAETPEVSHWWKNLGDKTVVLLSADLLKDKNDHNM